MRSYKKNNKYHLKKETTTKYYKYEYEPWEQPVLTSNNTIGDDLFAVTSTVGTDVEGSTDKNTAYLAFDDDLETYFSMHYSSSSDIQRLTFYNPIPISFSSLSVTFLQNSYATWCWRTGTLEGSDDNLNWTTISTFTNSSNTLEIEGDITKFYKYYRISTTGTVYASDYRQANMTNITFNGANQKTIIEASSEDYDFITQETKYFAFR